MQQTEGLLGISKPHQGTGFKELETAKSERTALGIAAEIEHFASPGRQVENKAFQRLAPLNQSMRNHTQQHLTSAVSDRAADAQLTGRWLKRKKVGPKLMLLSTDLVHHEVRCWPKNPSRNEEGFKRFRHQLWVRKHAPAKRDTYSYKTRARLVELQKEMIDSLGDKAVLCAPVEDFCFAPQI